MQIAQTWLYDWDLLDHPNGKELPPDWVLCRFWAFSKCQFRDTIGEAMRHNFLHHLLPCEDKFAVIQTNIVWVWDPKYHYHLDLTNTVSIWVKPSCLHPDEEA